MIGAYAQAILTVDLGLNGVVAIFLAGSAAAILSLVVGIPSLRLKGLYLAVTTLAFAFIMEHIVLISEDITRGSSGMAVPGLGIFGLKLGSVQSFYYVCGTALLLFLLVTLNLMRSRIGRAWNALHHQDIAAIAMGINVVGYKLMAFMVSPERLSKIMPTIWKTYFLGLDVKVDLSEMDRGVLRCSVTGFGGAPHIGEMAEGWIAYSYDLCGALHVNAYEEALELGMEQPGEEMVYTIRWEVV